jgi:hypothetical protein
MHSMGAEVDRTAAEADPTEVAAAGVARVALMGKLRAAREDLAGAVRRGDLLLGVRQRAVAPADPEWNPGAATISLGGIIPGKNRQVRAGASAAFLRVRQMDLLRQRKARE